MEPEVLQSGLEAMPTVAPVEKLIHLALPVRLALMQSGELGALEMACTYDIHPRGARLLSAHNVKVGDLVRVERGRIKSVCQVVWVADPNSRLRGQFTVECVEGSKIPWEDELKQVEERFLPVIPPGPKKLSALYSFRRGQPNRRRGPRYPVEGGADFSSIGGHSRAEGRLEQISEYGCLVSAGELLSPGTGLRLVLNLCDVSVAFRGHVRYTAQDRAMGVEFHEIRQGDRPMLDYVLNRLKLPRSEDFADLEVMFESLSAARAQEIAACVPS